MTYIVNTYYPNGGITCVYIVVSKKEVVVYYVISYIYICVIHFYPTQLIYIILIIVVLSRAGPFKWLTKTSDVFTAL